MHSSDFSFCLVSRFYLADKFTLAAFLISAIQNDDKTRGTDCIDRLLFNSHDRTAFQQRPIENRNIYAVINNIIEIMSDAKCKGCSVEYLDLILFDNKRTISQNHFVGRPILL